MITKVLIILSFILLSLGFATENKMTENEQYMDETISSDIKMGFLSKDEVTNRAIELVADNGFEKEISKSWVKSNIKQKYTALLKETKHWKSPSDVDLLIKVFHTLANNKIIALHNAGYTTREGEEEVADVLKVLKNKYKKRPKGFCFYHQQDLERATTSNISNLLLAFGTLEEYNDKNTILIGKQIVATLREYGFKINWDESASKRIEILNFKWQKLYDPSVDLMDYERVIHLMSK